MPHYTAAVTLLVVALYFYFAPRVAAAQVRLGVKLPATTGNADFERIFRAHLNTLEWMPTFLFRDHRQRARTRRDASKTHCIIAAEQGAMR